MITCGANPETHYANSSSGSAGIANSVTTSRNNNDSGSPTNVWYGMQFQGSGNQFRSPLSFLLDYTGILRRNSLTARHSDASNINNGVTTAELQTRHHGHSDHSDSAIGCSGIQDSNSTGEVSIIIGGGEQVNSIGLGTVSVPSQNEVRGLSFERRGVVGSIGGMSTLRSENDRDGDTVGERIALVPSSSTFSDGSGIADGDGGNGVGDNSGISSSHHRYDIQQIARWIEQILPFSLLLLVVFIRQHLQGFFVTIWISAVMFKSNDIVRKQTALKGDRRTSVLIGISFAFIIHVIFIYWWNRNDELLYSLVMLPPKSIPPFWHAIFIILVNDTMIRQAAMAFKCLLLIYYKSGRGHNFRRQGQMLTLVEYTLLLYRALLPAAVWYRFFLNKDYGSFFSSLTTGLYLTLKLTSVVGKVQCFLSAWKALSQKEVHYGVYATKEQVTAAGDLCAICQENIHAPVILRCKHIFCEECVSEWFERERTCPLCRALVKPAEMRTYGDGSTSLMFQLF